MYSTEMYEGMIAETTTVQGHNGDSIGAYIAKPLGLRPLPWYGIDSPRSRLGRVVPGGGPPLRPPRLRNHLPKPLPPEPATATPSEIGVKVTGVGRHIRRAGLGGHRRLACGFCGASLTSTARWAFSAPVRVEDLPSSPVAVSRGFDAAVDCWGGRVVASGDELTSNQPVAPNRVHRRPVLLLAGTVRQR